MEFCVQNTWAKFLQSWSCFFISGNLGKSLDFQNFQFRLLLIKNNNYMPGMFWALNISFLKIKPETKQVALLICC